MQSPICISGTDIHGFISSVNNRIIEINLRFEKKLDNDKTNIEQKKTSIIQLNNHNITDIAHNLYLDNCIKDLLKQLTQKSCAQSPIDRNMLKEMLSPTSERTAATENEYEEIKSPPTQRQKAETEVEMEKESEYDEVFSEKSSLKKKASVKSSKSVENIYEKIKSLQRLTKVDNREKDLSKSCEDMSDEKKKLDKSSEEDDGYDNYLLENGNSVELVFISDEYLNKISKEQDQVIVIDTANKEKLKKNLLNREIDKKIVVITDDYKNKILKDNTIVVKTKKKTSKKLKKSESMKAKAYNTNSSSFLAYEEPESLEDKVFKD